MKKFTYLLIIVPIIFGCNTTTNTVDLDQAKAEVAAFIDT